MLKNNKVRIYFLLPAAFLIFSTCSEDKIFIKKKESRKDINQLLKKYESENWEIRMSAVIELTRYITIKGNTKIRDLLLRATYDEHMPVRIEAIRGISRLPSEFSGKRISEIASYNKNSNERWYSLQALANYREKTFTPIFISGTKSDDWLIREISIKGLLMIDDIPFKYRLKKHIMKSLSDPNENVRLTTLNNIDIKDDKIYKEITKIFNNKKYYRNSYTKASLKALRGYKLDEKTRKRVINLLTDTNKEIRVLALKVLKDEKMELELK